jgi:pyruvate,water dikinase
MGGKAASLHRLSLDGFPVPDWFCLPVEHYRRHLEGLRPELERELQAIDLRARASVRAASERVRALIESKPLCSALADELRRRAGGWASGVAVRSSATAEDGRRHSFAGQLETSLAVSEAGLSRAVLRSWSSLFSPHALAYMSRSGVEPTTIDVGVVVQRMVHARSSGVLFTANPERADEMIIAGAWGLGEGVVASRVDCDTYRYRAEDDRWRLAVVRKPHQLVPGADGGVQKMPVPPERRREPALTHAQRRQLVGFAQRIRDRAGCEMDIEWCIDEHAELQLLQARPITALPAADEGFFDRNNVVESFPGVTLPLTYAHVRESYQVVFTNTLRLLGVPADTCDAHTGLLEHLLGYFRGRVYYSLANWYRVFALIPGATPYLNSWREMLGVARLPAVRGQPAGLGHALRVLRTGLRLAWFGFFLSPAMATFHRRFTRTYDEVRARGFEGKSVVELGEMYRGLNAKLLRGWEITFINDAYAFVFSSAVRALLRSSSLEEALFGRLLASSGDVDSVGPLRALLELAKEARGSEAATGWLEAYAAAPAPVGPPAADGEERAALRGAFCAYLDRYGDRSVAELKLSAPSFRSDPMILARLILRYARSGVRADEVLGAPRATRAAAEREVSRRLGLRLHRRLLIAACAHLARRSIRLRERSRLDRARAFGAVRDLFAEIGHQLSATGALGAAEDVHYLTSDELLGFCTGAAIDDDLRALVLRRRERFASYAAASPRPRFRTAGPAHARPPPEDTPRSPAAEQAGACFGQGCSSGVARGRSVVLTTPDIDADVEGAILVAEATDPGWIFLMVPAAGLVAERGSLLSHTAIIGRELGIPTVVGVADAVHRIPDGALLELDGGSGEVRILEAA